MTDDKTILEDLTPASAATPKIDAQLKTAHVPANFSPIKAIQGHTTWGATYLTYSAAYSATPQDAQAFLDATHAQRDTATYRSPDGCAPNAPGGPEPARSAFLKLWIDNGVIDHCATTESWHVPTSELTNDKAAATVYRVSQPPHAEEHQPTIVVVGVTLPSSNQG